jgi:hypothetical protein
MTGSLVSLCFVEVDVFEWLFDVVLDFDDEFDDDDVFPDDFFRSEEEPLFLDPDEPETGFLTSGRSGADRLSGLELLR